MQANKMREKPFNGDYFSVLLMDEWMDGLLCAVQKQGVKITSSCHNSNNYFYLDVLTKTSSSPYSHLLKNLKTISYIDIFFLNSIRKYQFLKIASFFFLFYVVPLVSK